MKKKFLLLLFLAAFIFPANVLALDDTKISKQNPQSDQIVPGEIIVKYKDSKINLEQKAGKAAAKSLENKYGLTKKDEVKDLNLSLVTTAQNISDAISNLKKDANVEYAEPNYKKTTFAATNDPLLGEQWALQNTGQSITNASGSGSTSGTANADIHATQAWSLESSSQPDVIVADIDTGTDLDHQDLTYNLWDGSSCVDENNNAISGGCPNHGWNYADDNNNPQDLDGHGTFVSGIIAAQTNNNSLLSGISYYNHVKLMPVKFGLDTISEIKAIEFAKNNGAKIINASFGGSNYSQAEHDAISAFGGIFVSAAGNNATDNDTTHIYPASYDDANIISVASSDQNDNLSSFSNYGTSVSIAAPGENIYSTDIYPSNKFTENFDGATIPNLPSTFSDASATWLTGAWYGTPSDHYVAPGETYNPNTNTTLTLSQPIDTTTAGKIRLQFYVYADIEYTSDCGLDSLQIQTDNNDGNWVTQKKICGYYPGETLDIDLTSAKSSSMRFRFVWSTNSTNNSSLFYNTPTTPHLDDVSLAFIANNSSSYAIGDGTSFAAPHVAGAAAMVESKFPTYTTAQVKNQILTTGDTVPGLNGKVATSMRLDLANAMQIAKAATPVASPVGGTYSSTQSVTLSTTTSGATIYYTTDGSDPTTSSTQYTAPITISATTTLKAIAVSSGFTNSDVMSQTYTISASTTAASSSPVYRFWSDQNKHHFYTISAEEKDYVIANYPDNVWHYEGAAFNAYTSQVADTIPVYRFWSDQFKGHFYTASEDEKNYVIANYPTNVWHYEGVAYYAYLTQQPNSKAIYRFWSDQFKGHFYTASEDEKNYIIAHYPTSTWNYEGIAYYVPTN